MSSSESCLMFPMASNNTVCAPVCGLCRSQVRSAHNLLFKKTWSSVNYYDPSRSPFSAKKILCRQFVTHVWPCARVQVTWVAIGFFKVSRGRYTSNEWPFPRSHVTRPFPRNGNVFQTASRCRSYEIWTLLILN